MVARRWKVLSVTSIAGFMTFLDATIVNVALPDLARSFPSVTPAGLSWVLSAYAIAFAAFLIPAGRAADLGGRRRVFNLGLAIFCTASALCGLAPSVTMLVAARVVQAVGAAMLVPTALALLLPEFPLERRSTAVGIWGAVAGVAAATGPSLGSAIVVSVGWRWVFLVNVPIGLLAWAWGRGVLRESRDPEAGARPDFAGAVLLGGATALLALGIVEGRGWGWTDARILGAFAGAAALLPLFVMRSRRHPSPVLDLSLFRVRAFTIANASTLLFAAAFYASLLNNVLFLTGVWQYSVLGAGLAITPAPLLAAATAGPAGRLADRFGHRVVVVPGALLYAAANLWFATHAGVRPSYGADWLPGALLLGAGVGFAFPTLGSAAATSLPPARFAVGSAVIGTARQLGGAIGVAALVAILGAPSLAEAPAAFDRAWMVIGAAGLLSGLIALWLRRPEPARALSPVPAAAGVHAPRHVHRIPAPVPTEGGTP